MRFLLLLIGLVVSQLSFSKNTGAFIVDINDQGMTISSPAEKLETVSVIIKNNTLDKVVSELRGKSSVLKRFVLRPNSKEVLSVNMKEQDILYFVPLSPPFESAKLKFKQKVYEIPKKNEKE